MEAIWEHFFIIFGVFWESKKLHFKNKTALKKEVKNRPSKKKSVGLPQVAPVTVPAQVKVQETMYLSRDVISTSPSSVGVVALITDWLGMLIPSVS